MPAPHLWESVVDDVSDWMDALPDQLAQDIIGEQRPFTPQISHEDQLTYHLEHLYPPQLGGGFDASYLAKIMATSTRDETKSLAQALDRHVTQKVEQAPTYQPPAPPGGLRPAPPPPRRY